MTSATVPSLASLIAIIETSCERTTFLPALQTAYELTQFPGEQPLAADLTADQRLVAEALAKRSGLPLSGTRVPHHVQFRRSWLGVDPPRTLDRELTVVHGGKEHVWPLWKAWQTLGDDPIGKQGLSALGLTTVEVLDAYVDVLLWGVYASGGVDRSMVYDHLDALAAEGGDWAQRRLDEMAGWPEPAVEVRDGIRWVKGGQAAFGFSTFEPSYARGDGPLALFVGIARAGRTIEPTWERLLPFVPNALMIEVAAALPEERRDAALLAAADTVVATDALRTCFTLWPRFPSSALFGLTEKLLGDRTIESGFPRGTLAKWRARWKALLATTPPPAEPAGEQAARPKSARKKR